VYKWKQETIKNVGVKCYNFLVSYKLRVFFAVASKVVLFFGFPFTCLWLKTVFFSFAAGAKFKTKNGNMDVFVARTDLIVSNTNINCSA
jgi:hypothetical protein